MVAFKPPSIGVIIPTRNRPDYLRVSLGSVLAQTYPADEILVSDNNSIPPAGDISRHLSAGRVHYHYHNELLPLEEHWHLALRHIQSDYACFLSDDDIWLPNHLAIFRKAYEKHPDYPLYGTAAITCASETAPLQGGDIVAPIWNGNLMTREAAIITREAACATFLAGTPFASCAVMVHRRILERMSLEMSGCAMSLDTWLWLQFALQGDSVYIPEITSLYRLHAGQVVKSTSRSEWRQNRRRYGMISSARIEKSNIDLCKGIEWLSQNTSANSFNFYLYNLVRVQPMAVIHSLRQRSAVLRSALTPARWFHLKFLRPVLLRICRTLSA